MRSHEFVIEAKVTIRDQIMHDVKKHGGSLDDYFVRFTGNDKLGFSAKQNFGRTPDADDPKFDPDYIGAGQGRPALWFYPLSTYLKNKDLYAGDYPYVWLVRMKPNSWLQPVNYNTKGKQAAPTGKDRVGLLRLVNPWPAAIFFKPAFDVVGKYYDYGKMHQRHGQVLGKPTPTLFQRIRGDV